MLTSIIKFFIIYYFCLYIYQKSLSMHNFHRTYSFTLPLVMAVLTYLLSIYSKSLSYTFPLLALWIFCSVLNTQPQKSFAAITISFTLSFSIHLIISFALAFLLAPFFGTNIHFSSFALVVGLIQELIMRRIFSIKRLRKGIPFFSSALHINIATMFGIALIGFTIFMALDHTIFHPLAAALLSFLTAFLTLAFLIYWWQAQIKKTYLRKLEIQELESTRTEMAELKLLNKQLAEENTRLSRISHRDNTLITALKNTATHLLSTLDSESAEAIAAGELLQNLETLSAERGTMASESEPKEIIPFETGYSLLDSVLNEMNVQAHRNAIAFSVHFGTGLDAFVPNGIAEIDLMHIVDDLLKNAFKSTLTKETRAVQLQFYKSDKHLIVEVADSGIPFEVESLINMGLERRTTYSDGSGIGLVEIWEEKEKYRATYHLEEYQNADPFTKRISIAFDKKNRYSIRTHRKEEILKQSRRADLQLYSDTE